MQDDRSLSISSTSVGSNEVFKSSKAQKWMYYKFASNWEYIILTLGLTINMTSFYANIHNNTETDGSNIIHNFVLLIIFGIPVCYAQVMLGQYSKLGLIYFKYLSPVGHGVGYAMLLISFTWCCRFGGIATDFILYLIACSDMGLDWMVCPNTIKHQEEICWSPASNCTQDCLGDNVVTSAFLYWRDIFMEGIDVDMVPTGLGRPIWKNVVALIAMWVVIYFIIDKGIGQYRKFIEVNLYMAWIMAILLLFVGAASGAASEGLRTMFYFKPRSFISGKAWLAAVNKVIHNLALSRACHVTFGSYMTADMPSDILVIGCLLLNFLAEIIGGLITFAYVGIIMTEAKTNYNAMVRIFNHTVAPPLAIIPLGIGTVGAPQFWTILYLLMNFLLIFNNLIIQIDIIRRSIADAHVGIRAYKNYVLVITCGLGCLVGIVESSKECFIMIEIYLQLSRTDARMFTTTIMTILLFWVYTVQTLSDDIHFLQGAQPTKFWKITWYIAPSFSMLAFSYERFFTPWSHNNELRWLQYLDYFFLISPIPVCFCIEIFLHLKAHNFLGILQPTERWGPPDPEERYLRNMFNPRQETRSRRRNDHCQHKCLLNSKKLQLVVDAERNLTTIGKAFEEEREEPDEIEASEI